MTHIGFIYRYNKIDGMGVIIDSHRYAHLFKKQDRQFTRHQFVTYEGEGGVVDSVIPLEEYAKKSTLRQGLARIFLTDSNDVCYELDGAESYIAEKILNNKCLLSDRTSMNDFQEDIKTVIENVNYVSSHLEDIASSYEVSIENWYITKIGGDDRRGTHRNVKLLYRDCYIDRFFLKDEELYRETAYHFGEPNPYKEGRLYEQERKDRDTFIHNYNKDEHLSALISELLQKVIDITRSQEKELATLMANWGVNENSLNDYFCFGISLEGVQKYNKSGINSVSSVWD